MFSWIGGSLEVSHLILGAMARSGQDVSGPQSGEKVIVDTGWCFREQSGEREKEHYLGRGVGLAAARPSPGAHHLTPAWNFGRV